MWVYCALFVFVIALGRTQLLLEEADASDTVTDASDTVTDASDTVTEEDIVTELETVSQFSSTEQQYPDTGRHESEHRDVSFMAAILYLDKDLLGTGAVVADQWIVVTAFQLGSFKPRQLRVRVGSKSPVSGGQLVAVSRLYVHPMFYQFNNDIALLKTTEVIQLGVFTTVIPVAPDPPGIGDHATFHHWGESSVESDPVDILPVTECRVFYPNFELTESNVCMVLDQILPHKVTLYGSPLTVNGSLVGLYMGLEADTFKPPLCTSLSPLVNWIHLMTTNETDALRIFPLL